MAVGLTFKDNIGTNVQADTIKSIVYEDNTGDKYTFGVDNITNVFNTFKYEHHGTAEVDYSATATKFMTGGAVAALLGIQTNVDAIKTKTDLIPDNFTDDVNTIKTQVGTNLISGIKAKTDNMPADLNAELTTITTNTGKIAGIETKVGEIKAKTDNMPADLNAELTTITTDTGKITAIGAKVDKIETKTDKIPDNLVNELASLAKSVDVNAIKTNTGKIADIGTNVGDIKAKTDNMPNNLKTELVNLTTIGNAISGSGSITDAAKVVLEKSFKQAIEKAAGPGSEWLEKRVTDIVSQPSFEIPTNDDAALNWTW